MEKQIILIEKVRQYEFLYNQHLPSYKDQSMRQEAWEEIGRVMKYSASHVKEMWTKLRNCYSNALKRRRSKSGDAAKKILPWKYEREMAFLQPYLENRQTQDNSDGEETLPTRPECKREEFDQIDTESEIEPTTAEPERVETIPRQTLPKKRKIITSGEEMIQHMKKNSELHMQRMQQNQCSSDLDASDMFYLSMSRIVKKLPPLDQAHIRMELCRLVSHAEIENLRNQGANEQQQPSSTPFSDHSFHHTSSFYLPNKASPSLSPSPTDNKFLSEYEYGSSHITTLP